MSRVSLTDWANWIVRADNERRYSAHAVDHACAECIAEAKYQPEMVVEGFQCVPHQAQAFLNPEDAAERRFADEKIGP